MKGVIIIIDDNAMVSRAISKILRREGLKVSHFSDPIRALEQFENVRPDIAIVDRHMSEMNGRDLITLVRKSYCRPIGLKIVAISGDPDAEKELLDAGADEFLLKPFGFDELITAIKKLLPQ